MAICAGHAFDDPHLPQRPATVQRQRRDMAADFRQLGPAARRRQTYAVQMAIDVEVVVIHPDRMVEIQRIVGELFTELWHRLHTERQRVAQPVEGVAARHRRRVQLHDRANMHGLRGRFQVQEAGVESGEPLHGQNGMSHTAPAVQLRSRDGRMAPSSEPGDPVGPRGSTRQLLGTMMSEQNVYGANASANSAESAPRTKIRTHHLQKMKAEGHKWSMLTAYDYSTARIFDEAGIPVLLVGDSAANVVYGYDTTVPVSIDELIPLVRGVVRGAQHALVVADLPFGSYEAGPTAALAAATRFMKEGGAHAIKLEGGERVAEQIACLTAAGIPVMAHIGFTPQSVNNLGGFRVQGRGDAAEQTVADAIAVAEAGAFSVVMEMVPAELATQITGKLTIPTIGIGAGPNCDAQVLVWQDMAGVSGGKPARFVKRFADIGGELRRAAMQYAEEVAGGVFPADEHCF